MAKDDSGFAEIEEYSKKLSHNPESLVFVPLAEAYRKSGMLDEAIETCLKGLQLHPSYMSARMVLGRAYMEKEMLEEACTEFMKVASADVNNIMAHSLLGQIFMRQKKFADAIKEYQKVLSLNPDDAVAQQMLNQALELARQNNGNASRPEPAAAPVSAAAKDAKESKDAPEADDRKQNLSKAEELSKQGDIDNAIKIYQLILEADPENLVVRQRLKDLELRKIQASTPARKPPERPKAETISFRDNDKITSDDILSVMKDSAIKPAAAPKPEPQPAAPAQTIRPAAPVAKPEPKVSPAPPAQASKPPVPATPASATPASATPASATPVPATPVPATPVPATPASATPVPATPVPATPVPATPASATPASATPASATPVRATPAPAAPAPATPAATNNAGLPSLAKLMQTEGILGSMIMDVQGAVLTSTFEGSAMNVKETAQTVALILGKTEKSIQAVDYGKELKQILITGEKGQIIFSKVNTKILLVLADHNINLGKMRLAMNEIIKGLR